MAVSISLGRCNFSPFIGKFPQKSASIVSNLPWKRSQVTYRRGAIGSKERMNLNVVDILEERGLIESMTHQDLRSVASTSEPPLKVYCGFDPTAESLHLGNLIAIIVLAWFQRCGHVPVALIGGATARIGDPSGKTSERPLLQEDTIAANSAGIRKTLTDILGNDNGGTSSSLNVVDNFDWWSNFSLLDFLRMVGRYARVGTMMGKESVKKRLQSEDGMSFTEFSYQLLQGYDFLHLFKTQGVCVQIGGSDQWGNITAGTELIRKSLQQEGAYGLTFPLLLKSDGTKFGKSEEGAVWLSRKLRSPYEFYQYFVRVADEDVIRFFKILSFLSLEEIGAIEKEMKSPGYVSNSAQRRLAEEVTRFVHGEERLSEALRATEALSPGSNTDLDAETLAAIAGKVPTVSLAHDEVFRSPLPDLCARAGLLPSKAAAKRLIKQGGIYLNNERVCGEDQAVQASDIVDGKMLLISAGKKNKIIVMVT